MLFEISSTVTGLSLGTFGCTAQNALDAYAESLGYEDLAASGKSPADFAVTLCPDLDRARFHRLGSEGAAEDRANGYVPWPYTGDDLELWDALECTYSEALEALPIQQRDEALTMVYRGYLGLPL